LNYTRAAPGPDQPVARPDIVPEPSQQPGQHSSYIQHAATILVVSAAPAPAASCLYHLQHMPVLPGAMF